MNDVTLLKTVHGLIVSVEALAALGAELRLRRDGTAGDPRIRTRLQAVVRSIDPRLSDEALSARADYSTALIQTAMHQAIDLIENPARAPGWCYEDRTVLQSQGQVSRLIVYSIDELAFDRPDLRAVLRQPGTLLDVGTGAGWLAIEAARVWPELHVVGIDVWEPALALARKNAAAAGFASRIGLRLQRVELLDEAATLSVAWFPGPFIAANVTHTALTRIYRALQPGGWLIFGIWPPSASRLEDAVANLRIVRNGGYPWVAKEVEDCLLTAGFVRIESLPPGEPGSPVAFVIGQRPS
jgi:SAM-dependent methyltransferase